MRFRSAEALIRRCGVIVALTAALFAGGASAGTESLDDVQPGLGIGKVRLGMTVGQVKRILGRRVLVNRRFEYGFGRRYVEYDFGGMGDWAVGFRGVRGGALEAARIGTTLRKHRTRGVGVGSTVSQVLRAYPRARCVSREPEAGADVGIWLVVAGEDAMLAFMLSNQAALPTLPVPRFFGVVEVVVQRDWVSSPGATRSCRIAAP